jgi:hypothetical protein
LGDRGWREGKRQWNAEGRDERTEEWEGRRGRVGGMVEVRVGK